MKKIILLPILLVASIALIVIGIYTYVYQKPSIVTDTSTRVVPKISYVNASEDMIKVDLPFPGAVTGKEFSVIGRARGTWFFEASFPLELRDKDGKVLVNAIAQSQGNWMTTDFVPFKVDIKVPQSYTGPATLVLKRDNPSGIATYDASASFDITVEY